MKVLLFTNTSECYASLSPKHATEKVLKQVKAMKGSFLHCPDELVALISGTVQENKFSTIMKDLGENNS